MILDPKVTFEDNFKQIDFEIKKRKDRWNLTAIAWMDFDDVSQILRIHIYKKWHLYDSSKPLGPWVNRLISNQIKNLIRNTYGNFARPCLRCAAAEGVDFCSIYGKQCRTCPLFASWEKTKKRAYDVKLPVSLENHSREVYDMTLKNVDIEVAAERLHEKMRFILKPNEWKIYEALYIEHKTEDQAAQLMGYRTSEKNRPPGYKQIKNIKKSIIQKVKKLLGKGEIDSL